MPPKSVDLDGRDEAAAFARQLIAPIILGA
jgi:hypothetical protein